MLLNSQTIYLVLHDAPRGAARQLSLKPSLSEAIRGWTAGSRLSPIWSVKDYDTRPDRLNETCRLFFLGPVAPARLAAEIEGMADAHGAGLWVTAGCFNVIVRLSAAEQDLEQKLLRWLADQQIAHEIWELESGGIRAATPHPLIGRDPDALLAKLASAVEQQHSPLLQPAIQENLVVTATGLARAGTIYPDLYDKLAVVADATTQILEAHQRQELDVLAMQSRLIAMNAAMSRFSSQAFSGTPPILSTECHFWIHSLLGTGAANLALARLVDSVQQTLGEARLPERLDALAQQTAEVPELTTLVCDAGLLNFDILQATDERVGTDEPIIPLITYFSGRDGFSSQLQTLSAPLTTLAECNSYRSNLLTVTHEVSHIFVQSALACLSPALDNEAEMAKARAMLSSGYAANNMLDAARQLLLEGVASIEQANGPLADDKLTSDLGDILQRWRHEMQEILVHSFDFLYFHQGDPEYYIRSIWHSWCSIPGISDRVPEYLMRTLCAVSAKLLGEKPGNRFRAALENVNDYLTDIQSEVALAGNYVAQALALIEKIKADPDQFKRFEKAYSARLYFVRLVRIFLYSETLAARLFDDPHTRPMSHDTDGKKRLQYDVSPIGNALTFLKRQLRSDPTDAESMWVLHCLAFDLAAPGGRP